MGAPPQPAGRLRRAIALAVLMCAGCAESADRAAPPTSTAAATAAPTSGSTAPAATAPPTTRPPATPGGRGLGDPAFTDLGNGGYDVASYDIAIDTDPAAATIDAVTTIVAQAGQELSRFDLDLHGLEVTAVEVDGAPAGVARDADELVVTPPSPVHVGATFTTVVRYHGAPDALPDPDVGRVGWLHRGATAYVVSEPNGAHTWFPSNDHPSDKATFVFHLTVPAGTTAVANGVLRDRRDDGTRVTWTWEQREPMATYLASVAVGGFTLHTSDGPHGVQLRSAFATRVDGAALAATARTSEMITTLESMFGPYPFAVYGDLVVDAPFDFALENQTLSLFPPSIATQGSRSERIQVHELAHQWFGDSVSRSRWSDIWLNEGFATYAEALWFERTQPGYDIDAEMGIYAAAGYGPIGAPSVDQLFGRAVYLRGALVLHALRRTIGDGAFFATLTDYATTYRYRNADTAAFVAVVERHAGRSMKDFFDQWLNAPQAPPLPR